MYALATQFSLHKEGGVEVLCLRVPVLQGERLDVGGRS